MGGIFSKKSPEQLQAQINGGQDGFFKIFFGGKFQNAIDAFKVGTYDLRGEGASFERKIGLLTKGFKKEMMVFANRMINSFMAQNQLNAMKGNKLNALNQLSTGKVTDAKALEEGLANLDPALRKAALTRISTDNRAKSYTSIEKAHINDSVARETGKLDYNKAITQDLTNNINKNVKAGMSKNDALNMAYENTSEKFGFENLTFSKESPDKFKNTMIASIKDNLSDKIESGDFTQEDVGKAFKESFGKSVEEMKLNPEVANKAFRVNVSDKIAEKVLTETKNAHQVALDKNVPFNDGKAVDIGIKNTSEKLGLSEKDVSEVIESYKKAQTPFRVKDSIVLGFKSQNRYEGYMKGDLKSSINLDAKKREQTGKEVNYKNRDIYGGVNINEVSAKQKKLDIKAFEKQAKAEQKLMKQAMGDKVNNIAELSKGR